MAENFDQQISRVHQMIIDDGDTWDLSPNDKAALRAVLDALHAALGWRDRPTCAGLWVHPACDGWGNLTAETYEEYDMSRPAYHFDMGPYFGPIQPAAKDAR